MQRLLIAIAVFPCLLLSAFGQVTDFSDTVAIVPDSLPPATARTPIDTAASGSGIDSVVTYSASDSIIYSLSNKTMFLYGKAAIRHKEFGLKAERIDINWTTSLLNAVGVPDTADSTGKKRMGSPDLIDGGETYKGSRISYNFESKRGTITLGETEMEKGFYYGEAIKKVDSDVMFVGHGKYTTCDLEHPHYYFGSPEMRVVMRENVVARPVYLVISDVPVFALPFGIFPNERGRRSGLIAPAYGESGRGRYLLHLGYYWAMSDYTDLSFRADGYTKGTWVVYSDFRYALRYNFTGGISGSYATTITGERGDPDFRKDKLFNLRMNHNQEFNPTTRLVVDFTFTSGSFYQQTSNNLNDLLQQNIVSNATLTKSWEGTPNSMTVNIRRDQNLQTGELRETLPSLSFNRGQSFPFRSAKSSSGDAGSLKWFELIGYTYNAQFVNTRNKLLAVDSTLKLTERRGVNHAIAINASPRVGYFTVTPFFNYTEKWYDKSTRRGLNPADSSVTETDVNAIKAVRFFDLGVSASTKIYGIFQPGVFGIKGLRHQVTPAISYTYQPDFSKPSYGYYDTYADEFGRPVKYSIYGNEPFGGAPAEERQAISFRIGNVLEMKTASSDTSGQDNKFQLLNFDIGTGYNFARDSLKFDEIGISYRTSIGQILNIGGSSRFNLYKFEPDPLKPAIGRRVNKFLVNEDGRLAQLTNFNISISTSLSGEKQETKAGPIQSEEDSLRQAEKRGYVGVYDEQPPDFSIPWNLQLSWNFSQNQPDPRVIARSSNIAVALGFNLTEYWKVSASTSYDVLNREFAAPQVTVYRDLHCWEMDFNWVPTGQYRNFRLEIRLKAPQLRDVKVTKQRSARDIF